MTEPKMKTNRLINEKSPYLLQHAYNPVDWYPWGSEAFDRAQKENKPILLSIGYSTCHWCHVMEHESFNDPEIAAQMNNNFVCIKVDREERPDVDKIYITAVMSLTQSAGWPLNVFLTPDLKPFFGGTYFPPKPRNGIVSWPDLINFIANAWNNPLKHSKIIDNADSITQMLKNHFTSRPHMEKPGSDLLETAFLNFLSGFDKQQGGFSPAPKFPSPAIQNFLLSYSFHAKNNLNKEESADKALEIAGMTLRAMANGGIYDHLGGGFHRYSTDAKWHVPHFEKMLYDNAQLIINYLDAFLMTGDRFFAQVAEETAEYVLRNMMHPEGGFYSAEDADSLPAEPAAGDQQARSIEGAFYVWNQEDINDLLGPEVGKIFSYRYGIRPEGNVEYDPHGDFKTGNVLFMAHSLEETAAEFGRPPEKLTQTLAQARRKLLQARDARPRPHLDDKILTSWNGLMISGLARAYQVLGKEKYLQAAYKSIEFIRNNLFDSKTKLLFRRWRKQESKIPGLATDYAFLIQSLLDLFESDFDPGLLDWAVELADEQIRLFYDSAGGGFFMTRPDHDNSLILRIKEDADSVIPSAGSIAVWNLMRLARLTDAEKYSAIAEKTLNTMLSRIGKHPESSAQLLAALICSLSKPVEIIITGQKDSPDTRRMLQAAHSVFRPAKVVMLVDGDAARDQLARHLPFITAIKPINGKAAAYVCSDRTCRPPITDPAVLVGQLN